MDIAVFFGQAGLGEYVEVFEANKISFNILDELSKEDIAALIPAIGDRHRFRKAIESQKFCETTFERTGANKSFPRPLQEVNQTHIYYGSPQVGDVDFDPPFPLGQFEEIELLPLYDEGNQDAADQHAFPENESVSSASVKKRRLLDVIDSIASPSSTTTDVNPLTTKEGLENSLRSCPYGEKVLNFFKKNQKLEPHVRDWLASSIVRTLMNHNKQNAIKHTEFQAVANVIPQLYPKENPKTYYIPPYLEGKHQKTSKGKLPNRYKNVKVAQSGSIKQQQEKKDSSKTCKTKSRISNHTFLLEKEYNEIKRQLQTMTEPWTDVLQLWKQSAPNRLRQLSSSLTITDILTDWPLLKLPIGYSLVSIDFNLLYPDAPDLDDNWSQYKTKLLECLKGRVKKDKSGALHMLKDLPEDISDDAKDAVVLHLLPSLLPPSLIRENNKVVWKPTISESKGCFVVYAKSAVDFQIKLKQRQQNHELMKRSMQPIVFIIGESIETVKEAYVIFEGITYKLNNVVAAVDICFKIFHTLNLEYPAEAENSWLFLQKFFYKIDLKKNPACVNGLISEL